MKMLRASAAIIGVLAIIVFVAAVAYQAGKTPVSQSSLAPTPVAVLDPPVWDWTSVHTETIAFQPGDGRMGNEVAQMQAGFAPLQRKRVVIASKSPVTVAYFPAGYRQTFINNPSTISQMQVFSCLNQHVLRATIDCTLDTTNTSYLLMIRDERTASQAFGAGVMSAIGFKKPLEDATLRNDVSIDVQEYRCVRNCTQYDQQR